MGIGTRSEDLDGLGNWTLEFKLPSTEESDEKVTTWRGWDAQPLALSIG